MSLRPLLPPLLLCGLVHCARHVPPPLGPDAVGVEFHQLTPHIWMHTSFREMPKWGRVPANGLVVVQGERSILVDTAWDDAQTEAVMSWAKHTLGKPIHAAVFTHAHDDKMGGVGALRRQQVDTYAAPRSNVLAPRRGLEPAEHDLVFDDHGFSEELLPLRIFDPGPGHTEDNIVVGWEQEGVLFGGCLVRPGDTDSLGNVADADIGHWAQAVEAAASAFPNAQIVVPSHGPPAGRELLGRTVDLARAAQEASD